MPLRRNEQKSRREHCFFEATTSESQRKEGHEFTFPIRLPTIAVVPRSGYNDDTTACGSVPMYASAPIGLSMLAYGADDAIPPTGDSRITFRGAVTATRRSRVMFLGGRAWRASLHLAEFRFVEQGTNPTGRGGLEERTV
jgi:hypothetical protein